MKKLQIDKTNIKILILICLSLLFIVSIIGIGATEALAEENTYHSEATSLSQMSDEECLEFLQAYNVAIPEDFAESPELGEIIRGMISVVESDYNYEFFYSYDVTYNFANEVKKAVVEYYKSLGVNSQQEKVATYATYQLQDSTLFSNTGKLKYYNCYAYAINRNEQRAGYPTDRLVQYNPGDFSNLSFSIDLSVHEMALIVKADLETIGFTNVSISTSIPTVASNEKLICIRKGDTDYHFMRYDPQEDAWLHKPAWTAILKYKYTPSNDKIWISEAVTDENGTAQIDPNTTYDSEIYFIKYTYETYTITLQSDGDISLKKQLTVIYGEPLPELDMFAPKMTGYAFDGYYSSNKKCYYKMDLQNDQQTANIYGLDEAIVEKLALVAYDVVCYRQVTVLYGLWESKPLECDYNYFCYSDAGLIGGGTAHLTHGASKISPANISGYTFNHFEYLGNSYTENDYIPVSLYRTYSGEISMLDSFIAYYDKSDQCIVEGTLITLANGTQMPVERLTGNEMLLVWNLFTGKFDVAPILFIDRDPLQEYRVIHLNFSDGTTVKVVSEHAFWDVTLNKYVYLREDAMQYIGHRFNKQTTDFSGNLIWTDVELISVTIMQEYTTVYSPITCEQYCYYVNGMLSMPGGIEGLINIFNVDSETMKYNTEEFNADIAQYGLFTYEELSELIPISEDVFNALNAQYLKVAIGKNLITLEQLKALYIRYAEFLA